MKLSTFTIGMLGTILLLISVFNNDIQTLAYGGIFVISSQLWAILESKS